MMSIVTFIKNEYIGYDAVQCGSELFIDNDYCQAFGPI